MSGGRFVAIHGHFYQPPRENPWLEAVEVQDSAHPFHDWNTRVTAECYAPNTAARRVDEHNRILDIVNNFERISFDVGPTLLQWLAQQRPDVYARILEADRASVLARGGHGNAIAQPYNHAIMPLATRRDKVTQVRWAMADFRHRFGREPEGMWLPETAVDRETLEVLIEHGIRFTILAPTQAGRVRENADGDWRKVDTGIDPSRAYRWVSPDFGNLALFFYDGPISRAIAFEGLLQSGDDLATRLMLGYDDSRTGVELVHVATDGESYGHHHRFGEMALAAACDRIERAELARLTNYGAFLAAHPPTAEVEIIERSSWSCAHGVERWRADCGCNMGHPGWHQRWRAPLREALDWLRDQVDPLFEARAATLLKDPWEARDDYIDVILERSASTVATFLGCHQQRPLSYFEQVEAIKLLELQRQRLLMYTSCGWFFDDVSGIETVQVLRYAARVLQLARELGGSAGLEATFIQRLALAPSNLPELRTGDVVYQQRVLPAVVDLRRVIAHYAIAAPYAAYAEETQVYAYSVSRLEWQRESYGDTSLTVGRVRVTSRVTTEAEEAAVAVLHFGGHDFHCAMRGVLDASGFTAMREEVFRCFASHSLSEVVRALDHHFEGRAYGIRNLFLEERRRILELVTESVLRRFEEMYRRMYEETRRLMQYLRDVEAPAPEALMLAARYVWQRDLERELPGLALGDGIPDRLSELISEGVSLGLTPVVDQQRAAALLEQALLARMVRLAERVTSDATESVLAVLRLGERLGCPSDLWNAQNRFFDFWRSHPPEVRAAVAPLAQTLGFGLESTGG